MKATLKRAFSRPIQMSCNAVTAICAYSLLPEHPSVMHWTAYLFIWVSLIVYGFDSYTEGMDRGIKIMEKLS